MAEKKVLVDVVAAARIGGNARAAKLTPKRRKDIARKAGAARWGKKKKKQCRRVERRGRWLGRSTKRGSHASALPPLAASVSFWSFWPTLRYLRAPQESVAPIAQCCLWRADGALVAPANPLVGVGRGHRRGVVALGLRGALKHLPRTGGPLLGVAWRAEQYPVP